MFGMATFLPLVSRFAARKTGGTSSARYCYSVWMRHLLMTRINGLIEYPKVIAELGPGDSLGIGLAALISGCEKYYAFDIVDHASVENNLVIFDELVKLFRQREPIPGEDEFPKISPRLRCYDFPVDFYNEKRLETFLNQSRLESIRLSIINQNKPESLIQYKAPWCDNSIVKENHVDMILSQAVLEHVDDLDGAYHTMYRWLRTGGIISHQIDFKSHGYAEEWNGHWLYSDFIWFLIRGRRPYFINRQPHSFHIEKITECGFHIICDNKSYSQSIYAPNDLAKKYKTISFEDLTTSGSFVQAVK